MSNAKTAATYLAELNGNAQDVSDWVLDLAARCDAAEAEVARCRPVVDAAVEWLAWLEKNGAAYRDGIPGEIMDAVDAYSAASPEATKAAATQAPAANEGAVVLAESADVALLKGWQTDPDCNDDDRADAVEAAQDRATIIDRGKLTALADGWCAEAPEQYEDAMPYRSCARELRALLT